MRAHRRSYAELSPEARKRANCRATTNVLVRRGKLVRGPCALLGPDCRGDLRAEHHDYDDPRAVTWKCAAHWTPRRG